MSDKIAGIWARVSSPKQQSLPSQVAEVKEWLESQGWTVPSERILTVDWTSKDILRCSEMQLLLGWVEKREVGGVGAVHLDRFAARPGQMAQIFDRFRAAGVELLLKDTPLPSGLMGELVALVLTLGKALQVERADEGAARGLRDRARLDGLPVSLAPQYGYSWQTVKWDVGPGGKQRPKRLRLVPNEDHPIARHICREALAGKPTRTIQRELNVQGVAAPRAEKWAHGTVHRLLVNPLYGGRYAALRCECVEPRERRTPTTYGKSSRRPVPFEQWVFLDEIEIVDPPLTWNEWLALRRRLEQNKLLAQRSSRRNYLLRGILRCGVCGKVYHGTKHHRGHRYHCRGEGVHDGRPQADMVRGALSAHLGIPCPESSTMRYQPGPWLEKVVKGLVADSKLIRARWEGGSRDTTAASLREEVAALERTRARTLNELAELERRSLASADEIHCIEPEVYGRLKLQYQHKLKWTQERREELLQQIRDLVRRQEAVSAVTEIYEAERDRFASYSDDDWRELFLRLGLTVYIQGDGNIELRFELPCVMQPSTCTRSP